MDYNSSVEIAPIPRIFCSAVSIHVVGENICKSSIILLDFPGKRIMGMGVAFEQHRAGEMERKNNRCKVLILRNTTSENGR